MAQPRTPATILAEELIREHKDLSRKLIIRQLKGRDGFQMSRAVSRAVKDIGSDLLVSFVFSDGPVDMSQALPRKNDVGVDPVEFLQNAARRLLARRIIEICMERQAQSDRSRSQNRERERPRPMLVATAS